MKLRTQKSYFNNLPEGAPPQRILPRITRLIYYLVLFALVAGVLYLLGMRMFYFSGRGQVERKKTILSSTRGGNIVQLTKRTGESFVQGEVLAEIRIADQCGDRPDTRLTRLQFDLKSREAQLAALRTRLEPLQQTLNSRMLFRALEIGDASSRRRMEELKNKEEKIWEQVQLLEAEILVRREELAALEEQLDVPVDRACTVETITAPFDGTVYHVGSDLNEYTDRGEPLLVVTAETAPVYVEAYLKEKYLQYVSLNTQMTVKFPDQYSGIGRVETVTSTAQAVAKRQLKDYVPTSTMIRVQVVPVDKNEAALWKKYDRIDVRVQGRKQ